MDTLDNIARRYFLKLLGGAMVAACAPATGTGEAEGEVSAAAGEAGYDYIVVGSGAGGGPLAANLARQGFEVLLLEAGEDQGALPAYQVPAFNAVASEHPSLRWDYFVRHYDDDAQQAKNPKATAAGVYYPRGGTLGGCTAVNALIAVYPHASDFQQIAELTGDATWSPENMRTYFARMEKCEYLPAGAAGHGQSGWLRVAKAPNLPDRKLLALLSSAALAFLTTGARKTNIFRELVDDVRKLIGAMNEDVNSASPDRDQTEGLYAVPLAMAAGARNGPREYVLKAKARYKLTVKTRALAAKVVFAPGAGPGGAPVAIGVDYLDGAGMSAAEWRQTTRYRADRDAPETSSPAPATKPARLKTNLDGTPRGEVILACGAFNTPQLLKLSGVGAPAELGPLGIPVLVDLPGVGKNLQDRYEISVVTKWSSDFDALNACTFGQGSDYCYQVWQAGRVQGKAAGAYATGPVAAMITRSSAAAKDPDLVIFGYPADFRGYELGYSAETVRDHKHFTWSVLKAHTNNTAGTVTLRSNDPRDPPDIRFRYFEEGESEDLAAVVKGVELARQIAKGAPALLASGPDPATYEEVVPGPATATPEQLGEFVKNEAWGHHASCTCPIGPRERGGVLDSRFRVHGTQGLRVVDASVFPRTPGFFLAVPIYMVSEKAFDAIVEDAGQTPRLGPI